MRKTITIRKAVLVTAIVLASCQQAPTSRDNINEDFIELGHNIVKTRCVSCHSATLTGESPRSDAPPLPKVMANYNPDSLADDCREHIHVGHPDMPDFAFTVKEVDGLLAYLLSIQEPQE